MVNNKEANNKKANNKEAPEHEPTTFKEVALDFLVDSKDILIFMIVFCVIYLAMTGIEVFFEALRPKSSGQSPLPDEPLIKQFISFSIAAVSTTINAFAKTNKKFRQSLKAPLADITEVKRLVISTEKRAYATHIGHAEVANQVVCRRIRNAVRVQNVCTYSPSDDGRLASSETFVRDAVVSAVCEDHVKWVDVVTPGMRDRVDSIVAAIGGSGDYVHHYLPSHHQLCPIINFTIVDYHPDCSLPSEVFFGWALGNADAAGDVFESNNEDLVRM